MVTFHYTGVQQRRIKCIWGGSSCQKNQDQKIYDDDGYRILDNKQNFCNELNVKDKFCPSFKDGKPLKWTRKSTRIRVDDAEREFKYVLMNAECVYFSNYHYFPFIISYPFMLYNILFLFQGISY